MRIVTVLAVLVLVSALAVVYTRHEARKLFVELDTLQKQRDEMNVEWGRLQIEQSTLATNGRIEKYARKKLSMVTPEYEQIIIVRP